MKNVIFLIIALLALTAFGCGSGKVGLSGHVTYSDDGSPLETGTVGFATDTYFARGVLDKDGKYIVSSEHHKDGLPPGLYKVYVSGAEHQIGLDGNGVPIMEPLIDARHTSASTSGLTLEVTAQTKTFDIKVDRYVPFQRRQ